MKKWDNSSLIIVNWQLRWRYEEVGTWFINYYYLTVKVNINNDTYTVLMSNYVSDIAYEAWSRD